MTAITVLLSKGLAGREFLFKHRPQWDIAKWTQDGAKVDRLLYAGKSFRYEEAATIAADDPTTDARHC